MQTRINSLIEQLCNVASGFVVSLLFWTYVIVPVWHLPVNMHENLVITACFTVLSVARGYIWRRLFNKKAPLTKMRYGIDPDFQSSLFNGNPSYSGWFLVVLYQKQPEGHFENKLVTCYWDNVGKRWCDIGAADEVMLFSKERIAGWWGQ